MSTLSLLVGASLDRAPRPGYFAELPFAELAFRKPLPRVGRLREWRASIPEGAKLALVVPRTIVEQPRGALRFDDTSGMDWLTASIEATRASTLVLATRGELTPGARDREMLVRFAERMKKTGARFVWEAGGVWEPEQAEALGLEHGWIVAKDLSGAWAPDGTATDLSGPLYVRIHGVGIHARLSEGLLATIAEQLLTSGTEEATVAVASDDAFRKAKSLLAIMTGQALGGGEGVLRRSASDDEDDEEGESFDDDE
jgi:uncharacterized protein YecE (DUF72 family)